MPKFTGSVLDVQPRTSNVIAEEIRDNIIEYAKDFKTAWVNLGQALYSVHRDKLYYGWGYDKFEDYVEQEAGLKKPLAMKLLKTYLFLEENEPSYLDNDFSQERNSVQVPGLEEINMLRLARRKKELSNDDYRKIKYDIFEKGKNASEVRKELTALMKEREQVDPDEERERRNRVSIKKFVQALTSFRKDMEVLKLIPDNIVEKAKDLMQELENI